jgi:hypothetical protein
MVLNSIVRHLALHYPLDSASIDSISRMETIFMSRKHWSDLLLIAAAISLVLGAILSDYSRLLALLAVPFCLIAGTLARRRMN